MWSQSVNFNDFAAHAAAQPEVRFTVSGGIGRCCAQGLIMSPGRTNRRHGGLGSEKQDVITDDTEIVPAIRRALADKIGAERYDLWFAASTRIEVRAQRLVVFVPNSFLQDWLRTNFRPALELTAHELLGPTAAVVFEVDAHLNTRRDAEAKANDDAASAKASSSAGNSGAISPTLRLALPGETDRVVEVVPKRITPIRRLNEFGDFVVGPTNRLAYASAMGVVERLGSISPLVLHGPTGVGKTHLMESIVSNARRQNSDVRAAYLSAEQFTTEFLDALHGRGLPSFRRKFRDLHLLAIDDVQFLAGKKATIVEFAHTLDVLQREGRQAVLTADRPPSELGFLGPEIRNRLSSGLACKLEAPDLAVRLGITTQMAAKLGLELPESVRQFVATHFSAHARELAGALKRLVVAVRIHDRPLDLAMAEDSLAELLRNRRKAVRMADIQKAVCDVFGLEPDALQSQSKGKDVSQPRMLAMWLARKYTRSALSEIGTFFGGRRHSTVISAHKKVDGWLASGEPVRLAVGRCQLDEAVRRVEETLLNATA